MKKILANFQKAWRAVIWSTRRYCRRLTKLQRILLGAGLGLFLLAMAAVFVLVWGWRYLPSGWPARIALNKLGASTYNDPLCHENCFYARELYKKIIAARLAAPEFAARTQNIILNEKENLIFREELIAAVKMAGGAPPDYLVNYLKDKKGNLKIKETIMKTFSLSDPALADDLINSVRDLSRSDADRLAALTDLENFGDDTLFNFYWDLLEHDASPKIKDQAITALSNIRSGEKYFTPEFFQRIDTLVLDPATDQYIRKSLVLFLADFINFPAARAIDTLVAVYNNAAIDKFTRAYAADILDQETANNYEAPAISEEEWNDYWNHSISATPF